jgi:hypothetical protein
MEPEWATDPIPEPAAEPLAESEPEIDLELPQEEIPPEPEAEPDIEAEPEVEPEEEIEPDIENEEDAELDIDPELPSLEETLEGAGEEVEAVIGEESPEDLSEAELQEDSFLDLGDEEVSGEDLGLDMEAEESPELDEESLVMDIPLEEEIEEEPELEEEAPIEEEVPEAEMEVPPEPSVEVLEVNEAPAAKNIEVTDMVGLLKSLKGLAEALPDKNKSDFLASDCRLSMEFIIDVLEGRKGLFRNIEERKGESIEEIVVLSEPAPEEVAGTLGYLEGLAAQLPDTELSAAIARKTKTVITELKQSVVKGIEAHEG